MHFISHITYYILHNIYFLIVAIVARCIYFFIYINPVIALSFSMDWCLHCVQPSTCVFQIQRNVKMDSVGILKIVLLVFQAVLLTDCARGQSRFINLSFSSNTAFFNPDADTRSFKLKLTGWFLVSIKKVSVGS